MHEMSPSENLYGGQFTLNIYIKPNYPLPPRRYSTVYVET